MTPLHEIGNFFRDLLLRVPLEVVRGLFLLLPVGLLVWVLLLPRSETTPPGRESRWDENLKLWAGVALLIQIVIYSWI
jgi:hypothetical protein